MILACAAIDIAAACFAVLFVIGLLSWRWNGEQHSGDDRGPQDGRPPGPPPPYMPGSERIARPSDRI